MLLIKGLTPAARQSTLSILLRPDMSEECPNSHLFRFGVSFFRWCSICKRPTLVIVYSIENNPYISFRS